MKKARLCRRADLPARRWAAICALLLGLLPALAWAQDDYAPPEPETYREDNYRSPVPRTLRGAETVDTAELIRRRSELVVIDVLPQMARPPRLAPENVWLPPPHIGIPGSFWLPNVGYGLLPPVLVDYFTEALRSFSGGDFDRPLVFYCRSECWMSWNAAKRALTLGYRHVLWYRDGIEAWQAAGQPTEVLKPFRDGPPV